MLLKPSEVRIQPMGVLLDTLGAVELEAVGALIVRWHQVHELEDWAEVSRREISELFDDAIVKGWCSNPFWRPDPLDFAARGYITNWSRADTKGELTPKFHEALWKRAQLDRELGQHVITLPPKS